MTQREFYSEEAEGGLIGALMRKPELCEEIGATLSAADFYNEDLSALYTMVLAAHSKGEKPDVVSLADIAPTLPSGESTIYLAGMIAKEIVSAANAATYARVIAERSSARKLFVVAQKIKELSAANGPIHTQIAQAQQMLMDLSIPEGTPDVVSYADRLPDVLQRMEDRRNGTVQMGIHFGLDDLDKIVRGLRPGNLVVIAGKPGTGKTVMATGLADKIALREHKSSLIFSLEMSTEELINRSLAAVAGVSKELIDSGRVIDCQESSARLFEASNKLHAADVRICDMPVLEFGRLCNIARFQHRARKLDLIVIDYLTLIRSDAGSRHGTRSAEIGSFTRGLKALGKELGVPVVVLAQLNRAMDSRTDARPRLSDLRDSGEIEQDADVVILGHRDEKDTSGITQWIVAKCRHSRPGDCVLQLQGDYQRFVGVAKADAYSYERMQKEKNKARDLDGFEPGGF